MNPIKEFLKPNNWVLLVVGLVVTFSLLLVMTSQSKAQINFGDNPNFDPYGRGAKIIIVAPQFGKRLF